MGYLALTIEIYLAGMLGISGIAKLQDVDEFANTLRIHRILPTQSVKIVSRIFPWIEIILACFLVFGIFPLFTSALVCVLFATFLGIEVVLVVTRRATDCGCYGVAYRQKVDSASIVVSTLILSLTIFHLWLVTWIESIDLAWRVPVIILFCTLVGWLLWRTLVVAKSEQNIAIH